MSDPAERCNDCGLPRREHHHDGAAYGTCGQFSEVGHSPSSPGTLDALKEYISDWARIIWDATGDQTKVDRVILLADLNGMFDPVKIAGLTGAAQAAIQPATNAPPKIHYFRPADAQSSPDPTNHHNAMLCPYCNPDGLKFAAPPSPVAGEWQPSSPVKPRRPLDDCRPDGYSESDRDFINNNQEAILEFLERHSVSSTNREAGK